MTDSAELPVFHVVGFTGHRNLKDKAGVERAMRAALEGLRAEADVEWLALSSIAEGADMLFARTALRVGFGWEAVLPMPPVEFRADFGAEVWREVEGLLGDAEHVRIIGERSHRDDSYLDCGMETVNHCDVLLAVWDGERSRGRGGTAEIIGYARSMGRPIIIIDAATLAMRRENFDRLKMGNRYLTFFNQLPPAPPEPPDSDPERARVRAFQRKVDHAATKHAPNLRRLYSLTVGLFVFATVLAAVELNFGVLLPWAKLICLVAAMAVAFLVIHKRWQYDWVRCRLATEISRSALATWGLPRALRLFDDFDWAGVEPLRRSLDVLHRRGARAHPASFDEFKQRYLRERIDDQLIYFARQEARATPLLWRLRFGFFVSSTLAICFTGAYAQHHLMPDLVAPDWVHDWVYGFGPVVLPVLAAAFISLISIHDLYRRVARYQEMRIRLETARKEATYVQTWGALERVIAKAERALLQEIFEWHSITTFAETH